MKTAKSRAPIPARQILADPYCFLAFGFGSGLAPVAPGTFGTLAALPLYALLSGMSLPVYVGVVVVLLAAGVRICERCEARLAVHDHSGIVWDEIVGVLITLWGVPPTWQNIAAAFLLFRLFDASKPWPIRWLDRHVHGGLGIMLDDAAAGLFGWAALQVLLPLWS